MRITIVPDDGLCIVDGIGYTVDCSSVDPAIHAVQWFNDHGDIEFKEVDGQRQLNEKITDMTPFATVLALWNVENAKPKPQPIPAPAATFRQNRMLQFKSDPDREKFSEFLRTSTSPLEIRNYVNQSVSNIESAKKLLSDLLVLLAPML